MHTTATASTPSSCARCSSPASAVGVERAQHRPVGADPLVDLDHPLVEQLGQDDVAVEDPRSVLVADPQRIPEAR